VGCCVPLYKQKTYEIIAHKIKTAKYLLNKIIFLHYAGHSKSTYALKGEGVLKKALKSVQKRKGRGVFKERTYAQVFLKI